MINVTKIGDWTLAGQLLSTASKRIQAAVDKAMLQEGRFLRTKIVEGLREQAPGGQAFTSLAPTTRAIRDVPRVRRYERCWSTPTFATRSPSRATAIVSWSACCEPLETGPGGPSSTLPR
jgi:hypothetical protein